MAARRRKLAAIDVGTTKVCTIMADYDGESLRVLGVGIVPSKGLQRGMVVSFEAAKQSIKESVKMAEQSANYKLESACIGITGRHVTSTNNKGAIAITRNDKMVRSEDMKRVLDVARSVSIAQDTEVLHVIPRTYTVDGQGGVKNPVGMHGFRLDVETHIIIAGASSVKTLTKCIRSLGIEISDVVLEPLASAEAVLTDEEMENGAMLVDIGGGTTDIAIYKDTSIYHTAVLPVAGNQITQDIAIGLNVSFDIAENMKKRNGSVMPADTESDSRASVNAGTQKESGDDLSEILRMRVEELLHLIRLEMPQTEIESIIPCGVVITGGGANLHGLAEFGSEVLRMPVRIGLPVSLYGVSDKLDDPSFSTGVGLLLWQMRHNDEAQASKQPTAVKTFTSGIQKLLSKI